MRKLVVFEHLSFDGVMPAPAGRDEDTRGGFAHGGWALPYEDKVKGKTVAKSLARSGPLLFGRRTYEHMFETWHGRNDGNPFSAVLEKAEKYVVSNTLKDPLPWESSTLIKGDPADRDVSASGSRVTDRRPPSVRRGRSRLLGCR